MYGFVCWHLLIFPGSFPPSIFSASELNFRVRYGNGWTLAAINTNFIACLFDSLVIIAPRVSFVKHFFKIFFARQKNYYLHRSGKVLLY